MKCVVCSDPTPQVCDDCGRPHCAFCMRSDDAGQRCEACDERVTAESLEACGGEKLMRQLAAQERWEREVEGLI